MKKDTLLIEIGTEELPAAYIAPAVTALARGLLEKLKSARIECDENVQLPGTPRRLAVIVPRVAEKQTSVTSELIGPPVSVGLDASGKHTLAAEKFAARAGVRVSDLVIKKTDKGDYLGAETVERGRSTRQVLKEALPAIIASLPFPKSMKWGELNDRFARPVHSLVALYGRHLIGFSWAGIKSGRHTPGHFFMAPARIRIAHPDDYVASLRQAMVLVDISERRQRVIDEIAGAARATGGNVLPDEELVEMVTQMVEYPVAACGRFDDRFLQLPREVLIMSMRSHQRYFAVVDSSGGLMPCFVAVNNTRADDMNRVARGHERVLRARLEDAMFFYQNDVKISPDRRVDDLKRVLFQARLGSMYDKMIRLQALLSDDAFSGAFDGHPAELKTTVLRAAELCKTDLVTRVVDEFPKLQGTMGRIYAAACGETPAVAQAIEEHYRPVASGADLPDSIGGALLAVAEKLDTIGGCFAVGLAPSGASDPYALRRHGIGMIQILLNWNLSLSLAGLVQAALARFTERVAFDPIAVGGDIIRFLEGRMAQLLVDEGIARDVVNAVLNASADCVPDVWHRAGALFAMKTRPDFEPLAAGFKRVANIIKKSASEGADAVRTDLFQHDSEKNLYTVCQQTRAKIADALEQANYEQVLTEIAALRGPVDVFFDHVLVMAEATDLRANRLALLLEVASLFTGFADFSVIATEK